MNKYSKFGFGADDQPPPSTNSPPLPAIEIPNSSKLGHQNAHDFQIPNSSNPAPLRWFLPGFFDGVEYDEVDTTLSLRPPGTTPPPNKKSTKPPPEKREEPQTSAAAANNNNSNIPLPTLLINFANNQSRKRPRINTADTDHPRPPSAAAAAIPPPPRWLLPGFFDGIEYDEVDTTLSLRPPGTTPPPNQKSTKPPPEKREDPQTSSSTAAAANNNNNNIPLPPLLINSANNQSRKRPRINTDNPSLPIAPAAVQRVVESFGGGVGAVKLGWQKLEELDLGTRLLVTIERQNFWRFMRSAEAAAAYRGGEGLAVVGVDAEKRVYPNLRMTWRSNAIAIEREWSKVIGHNKPKVGNVVDMWGFRVKGRLCLAFYFREETDAS